MMSSEEDTDCCYGLQYGETTTTAANVLQLNNFPKNQKLTTTTTTTTTTTLISNGNSNSSSSSSGGYPGLTGCSSPGTTTTTTCTNTGSAAACSNTNLLGGNNNSPLSSLNNHKRTRQRVDAGEPRNSYSSIPNFTSRPTFMSGGLYGAIFSQTAQQHFSLFSGTGISGHPAPPQPPTTANQQQQQQLSSVSLNSNVANNNISGLQHPSGGGAAANGNNANNCAQNNNLGNSHQHHHHHGGSSTSNGFGGGGVPVKMLNELLGRQVKQAQDATGPDGMIQSSTATNASSTNLDNFLASAAAQQEQQQQFSESADLQNNLSAGGANKSNSSGGASPVNNINSSESAIRRANQLHHGHQQQQGPATAAHNHQLGNSGELLADQHNNAGDDQHDHLLISSTSTPTSQSSQSPPVLAQNANELAQHMLRNILQQSKKDLLAFDQEMQRVAQRQLGLDSSNSDLCAMISDSAKQLTKQMVKLEMDSEEAVHNSGCTDLSDENNGKSATKSANKISGKCLENGTADSDKQQQLAGATLNGVVVAGKAHDNNNNENNANMNVQSDNDDNSMHSALNEKAAKDDDLEMLMDHHHHGTHHHHHHQALHNHNSMDALEKRRHSSVSPIISSSSSSTGGGSATKAASHNGEPVALDMKRARVENIVSTMRSSPALPQQNQSAFTPTTVNGCKKRKLYHPQQHDSAADRYAAAAAAGLNLGLNLQNLLMANSHLQQTFLAANAHLNDLNDEDMDEEHHHGGRNGDVELSDGDDLAPGSGAGSIVEATAVVHQKREEKNALKSQLRSMQEQLAEMQQKYVQLCTRMEQESEAANTIADDNSDTELMNEANMEPTGDDIEDLDDDDEPEVEPTTDLEDGPSVMDSVRSPPPVITTTTTPLLATTTTLSSNRLIRSLPSDSNNNNIGNKQQPQNGVRPTMNQVMNKMSNKMGGNLHPAAAVAAALHSQLPLGGPFGGGAGNNPLFHHLQQQQQHGPNGGQSAAAAAAAAHELLQQQQNNSAAAAQQHALSNALSNAWASQKLFLEQEARNLLSKEEDQRELMAMRERDREQRTPQNNNGNPNAAMNVQREVAHNNQGNPHQRPGQKMQDRLGMMRSNSALANNMIGPIMSGSELEGLADMLKSEITASLSHLVDTIVARFLHQKRFLGKQSEAAAAAAEQLSKDLMMATQLLDGKSPRTKVADRPTGPNQSAAMFQTPKPPSAGPNSLQASHNSKVSALNQVAAAALYNSMNQFCMPPPQMQQQGGQGAGQQQQQQQAGSNGNNHMDGHSSANAEQTEALPLVVVPKKKRHKVTDTRITPRTVSRILAQDGILPSQMSNGAANLMNQSPLSSLYKEEINNNSLNNSNNNNSSSSNAQMQRDNSAGHQLTSPVSSTATTLTSPQQGGAMSAGNTPQKSGNGGAGNGNNGQQHGQNSGSTNSPMNSPQSRQSHMGGNPNAPMHLSQGFHPSLPSLPPTQQSMMPVSLPTSVAIPNPSLPEESEVFSPYSPLFNRHSHAEALGGAGGAGNMLNGGAGLPYGLQPQFGHHHHHHIKMSSSPPGMGSVMLKSRDSPPLPLHHSTMLHPALLAAAHHGNSPDYSAHMRHQSMDSNNNNDRSSDCNDLYDGLQPTISFFKTQMLLEQKQELQDSLTAVHSSTLTPMHLRKAKLMFFWVRYPSSAVLKMYFPDIRFNKNNTAQLVKWFSNFREFYYIQMEKYARQSVTEGAKSADELQVTGESEIYRVLNLHYNRNNHIEVPQNFRYVVEQTLREFFKSIQCGKDSEQSWKKSIYKIISRLDDPVPEYFKSPNFLEQLE